MVKRDRELMNQISGNTETTIVPKSVIDKVKDKFGDNKEVVKIEKSDEIVSTPRVASATPSTKAVPTAFETTERKSIGEIWDSVKNGVSNFTDSVDSIGTSLSSNISQVGQSINSVKPTVQTKNDVGLDSKTMLFLGIGIVGLIFSWKSLKKK